MPYLRNTWYVAAIPDEVSAGALLARRYLNEPVILFRTPAGEVRALADICPHRMAPLHRGVLTEGVIQCGYHGLKFDSEGVCVHSPYGPPPPGARVRTYPVIERHSVIWIWMGDQPADPALIPDFSFQDPDKAYVGQRYLNVKARYELEVENILDLSHTEFLHPTTLGSGQVAAGQYSCEEEGDYVWSRRDVHCEVLTHDLSLAMGVRPGEPVDRWIHVRWSAPSYMALFAGAVPTGRPKTEGHETPTAHLFTPETDRTSHYWFSISFPKAMGPQGAQKAQDLVEYLRGPFETEDLPMLEDQQANVGDGDLRDLKWLWLPGDAAGARARHALRLRIEAEQAA